MAADITASLRQLDPADPVRYDFALCHVGMRDQCGFNRPVADARCPLRGFCRPRRCVHRERLVDHPLDAEVLARPARARPAPVAPRRPGRAAAPGSHPPAPRRRAAARAGRSRRRRRPRGCRRPRVATIGRAAAIASSSDAAEALGDGAHHEQVEPLQQAEHVGPEPGEDHVLRRGAAAGSDARASCRSSPSPRMTNRASGTSRTTIAAASTRYFCPLCGTSAAMLPTTSECGGNQNSSRTFNGSACSTRSTSMPSWTVTIRSPGRRPRPASPRIASDAAMKPSTCRYFHRENELPLRWKSTRRATTSGGRGDRRRRSTAPPRPSRRRAGRARGRRRATGRAGRATGARPPAGRSRCAAPSGDQVVAVAAGAGAARRPGARRRRRDGRAREGRASVSSTWFWPPRQVRAVSIWTVSIYGFSSPLPSRRTRCASQSFANFRNT